MARLPLRILCEVSVISSTSVFGRPLWLITIIGLQRSPSFAWSGGDWQCPPAMRCTNRAFCFCRSHLLLCSRPMRNTDSLPVKSSLD
ncbi:hypothetical protein OBBRIDRAFT_795841 [Obba rivulosa]|uniref:Uncharacterized protein n=1 Tax=Obba rivulosa TaxID=1052685 RepID=A0A8E2AYN2_9APHY|nr:hypothetical protein OBBRIDRAFT_795841 [Obba rivulosa]